MTLPVGRLQSVWTTEGALRMHTRLSVNAVSLDRVPVCLIHGLSVSSRYMVPTAVRLAPHYRVYAPDLPGFGKSAQPQHILNVPELADALVRRMDAFGLDRAVLVGNSLGCQIIVDLAVRYPKRVAATVLIGPTMDSHGRTMLEQARRLFIDGVCYEPLSSILTQGYDYCIAGPRRTLVTLHYALEDKIELNLPHVVAPTLVIRGSNDPIVPQRWAEEITAMLPNGRLFVIPGAPHAANFDTPVQIVRAVLTFLGMHGMRGEQADLANHLDAETR